MKKKGVIAGVAIAFLCVAAAATWHYKRNEGSMFLGWTRAVGAAGRLGLEEDHAGRITPVPLPLLPSPFRFVSVPQGLSDFRELPSRMITSFSSRGASVLAGTYGGGLASSINSGVSWKTFTTAQGLPHNRVYAVFLNDKLMLAGFDSGVALSRDEGATWQTFGVGNGFGLNTRIVSVYGVGNSIFAGSIEHGLRASFDNGATWKIIAAKEGFFARNVAALNGVGDNVFAGTEQGVFGSKDGGKTWDAYARAGDSGLGSDQVRSLALCGGRVFAGTSNGLFRSNDYTLKEFTEPSFSGWPANFGVLSVDAKLHENGKDCVLAVGLDGGGFGVSYNDGDGWLFSQAEVESVKNDVPAVAILPGKVIINHAETGVHLSDGKGGIGVPVAAENTLRGLPVTSLFVSGLNVFVGTHEGLNISRNGGAKWSFVPLMMNEKPIQISAMASSGAELELFALGSRAACRSADFGTTWECFSSEHFGFELKNGGLRTISASKSLIVVGASEGGIAISRKGWNGPWERKEVEIGGGDVYSALISDNKNIFVANAAGLAISRDGGVTWLRKIFAEKAPVTSVAVHDERIAVTLQGAGIMLSSDSGVSWSSLRKQNGLADDTVAGLALSGGVLYAATKVGLSSSADGGRSWSLSTVAQGVGSNEISHVVTDDKFVYVGSDVGLSQATLLSK
jgi:photosystem II stability/assembly factor-like uncharacterized protein